MLCCNQSPLAGTVTRTAVELRLHYQRGGKWYGKLWCENDGGEEHKDTLQCPEKVADAISKGKFVNQLLLFNNRARIKLLCPVTMCYVGCVCLEQKHGWSERQNNVCPPQN